MAHKEWRSAEDIHKAHQDELLAKGYGAVVKGRVAHRTDGSCWSEKDWLIPLKDLEEAKAHGYEVCKKCRGSTSEPETSEKTDS